MHSLIQSTSYYPKKNPKRIIAEYYGLNVKYLPQAHVFKQLFAM